MPNILLIVEDSPMDAELTIALLRKGNVTASIEVASDKATADRYIFQSAETPRLILLDLRLPDIDGRELLQQIREDSRTQDIPVIILTGAGTDNDLIWCYLLGITGFIVKPIDLREFKIILRREGMYHDFITDGITDDGKRTATA